MKKYPHFQRVRVLDPAYPAARLYPRWMAPLEQSLSPGANPASCPQGSSLLTPKESTTIKWYGHKSLSTYSLTHKEAVRQHSAANGRNSGSNGNTRRRNAEPGGVTLRPKELGRASPE